MILQFHCLRINTSAWHLQPVISLIKVNISEKIKENRCSLFKRPVLGAVKGFEELSDMEYIYSNFEVSRIKNKTA